MRYQIRVQTSVGKEMAGVLWYSEGILLGDFLKRCATVNTERCVRTIKELKHQIRIFQQNKEMCQALIIPTVLI